MAHSRSPRPQRSAPRSSSGRAMPCIPTSAPWLARRSSGARWGSRPAPSCGGSPRSSLPDRRAEAGGRGRRLFILATLAVGFSLLVLLVVLSDGRELLRTAASVDPALLALPVGLTILSYAAMSRSYQGIAEAAGCRLGFGEWLRITFVSNTVNYLVTSAGLSGFAVRMYLLSQRGIPSGRAVLISLVQTFLTNFTASTAVAVFVGMLAYGIVLIYHRRLRRRTMLFLADAAHRVLRRVVPRWTPRRVGLWRFQHNLNEGLEFLFARKDRMLGPAGWITIDWALTITILWSAFRSVHYPIAPGLVVIGFAVGILFSLVSLVPGGLGVMEGSMTAVFVSLSVPLEPAIVAVLIFRLAYYVIPLLVSVVLFHGVMLQAARGVASSARPISSRV
ncbi:MAG: flippase-like domain-containing protein [Deltaproteobacteria bacterium]|nr:MAG: flippase-like domain-containing protein [Deltaproteobacteria bacterium]